MTDKVDYIPTENIKAESLESDPSPEFSIDEDTSNIFKSEGKGRVLRHRFDKLYHVTDIEIESDQQHQLLRCNSVNYQTGKPGEILMISFRPPFVTKTIDLILHGTPTGAKNSIVSVKYKGYIPGEKPKPKPEAKKLNVGESKQKPKPVNVKPEDNNKKEEEE